MKLKATDWEFRNRAMVFGLIYGISFAMYAFDHDNSTAALANAFVRRWNAQLLQAMGPGLDATTVTRLLLTQEGVARLLFLIASIVLVFAALARTWASAYLHAGVVYASQVKSDALVAGGPYRWVRNPLYFGNVLMASGLGAMMSNSGATFCFIAMVVFCYRLIFREEGELSATQGERYATYRKAIPRLWPGLLPRIPRASASGTWLEALKAESWSWGFAASVIAFTITLKLVFFFGVLGISVIVLFAVSAAMERR